MPICRLILLVMTVAAIAGRAGAADGSGTARDDRGRVFHEEVAPLLVAHCVECHNPATRKGGLSVETLADVLKGGEDGPAVVPGRAEESPLFTQLVPAKAGGKAAMPKRKPALAAADLEKVRRWIDAGAAWPKEIVVRERSKADGTFWSFQPVGDPSPPNVAGADGAWLVNPVDRFVLAKLRERGLTPGPPADARVLVRRATYDLTGLPPTPEEVEAFVRASADDADRAMSELVDRLLAPPAYGERWGRHWLDVVRFGESRGFERNHLITNLWPFRDYVIRSFNDDKPFDRMIREHVAGDAIAGGDPASEVGAAFLVAGAFDDVNNQDAAARAQIRADTVDEMIRATGEAFLGLTIGCARCHDHKFDPIATRDYYAMAVTFAGVVHGERPVGPADAVRAHEAATEALRREEARIKAKRAAGDAKLLDPKTSADEKQRLMAERKELDAAAAKAKADFAGVPAPPKWWVGTRTKGEGPFHVFVGGDPQKRGDTIAPGSLAVLAGRPGTYALKADAPEAARRVALADWLASADNPLTPRVLANRVWHYHFGRGIVDTPSDFGHMGGRPTHPELLDFLARQLIEGGWRVKPLHRLITTSRAYRQSSAWREDAGRLDRDARLLWRFPPRRLSAEEVRDTLLAVSGKLDRRVGGPGYRLFDYQQDNVATYVPLDVHGPDTYRRAVYAHTARAARADLLSEFDAPDPALPEPRRAATTTPLQALTLLNHKFSLDMAAALAERLTQASSDPAEQVRLAYALAYGRSPTAAEVERATAVVRQHGLRPFCRAVLNSSEMISVD